MVQVLYANTIIASYIIDWSNSCFFLVIPSLLANNKDLLYAEIFFLFLAIIYDYSFLSDTRKETTDSSGISVASSENLC